MITVHNRDAEVKCKEIQEIAEILYEKLTYFRDNYVIDEDSEENGDNNFVYLSGSLEELIESEVVVQNQSVTVSQANMDKLQEVYGATTDQAVNRIIGDLIRKDSKKPFSHMVRLQ